MPPKKRAKKEKPQRRRAPSPSSGEDSDASSVATERGHVPEKASAKIDPTTFPRDKDGKVDFMRLLDEFDKEDQKAQEACRKYKPKTKPKMKS